MSRFFQDASWSRWPSAPRPSRYYPSEPDFAYGAGYLTDITHELKDNGIFWNIVSDRWHADKRDTEGDVVVWRMARCWLPGATSTPRAGTTARRRGSRCGDRPTAAARGATISTLQENDIGTNAMSVSLLRTSNDTVLLTFLAKNGPEGAAVHYVRRSTDGGYTFGEPILANVGDGQRIANNDRFLELRDPQGIHGDAGRITLTCRDYPGRIGVMVYSDDDGQTWQAGGSVPVRPDWGSQNFNEPGIVELDDGQLWMYGRTLMGFYGQSWSNDRGMTWSTPEPMELLSPYTCPLTGERVPNTPYTEAMGWAGDILLTFANWDFVNYPREFNYTARNPLDAAISARWRPHLDPRPHDRGRPRDAVRLQQHHISGRRGSRHARAAYDARPADSRLCPSTARLEIHVDPVGVVLRRRGESKAGINFADEYPPDAPRPSGATSGVGRLWKDRPGGQSGGLLAARRPE